MYGRKLTDQQVQAILKFLQSQEFQTNEKNKQGEPIKKKIDLGANNDKTIFQSSLNEKLGTANRATSINDFKATIMGSDSGFNTISVNPKSNTAQDILDTIASQTLSSNPPLPFTGTTGSTVRNINSEQPQKDAADTESAVSGATANKIPAQHGDSSTSTPTSSNIPGTSPQTGDGKPQPPVVMPKKASGVTPTTPGQSSAGSASVPKKNSEDTTLSLTDVHSAQPKVNTDNAKTEVKPPKSDKPGTTNTNLSTAFSNPAISVKNATFTQAAIKQVC